MDPLSIAGIIVGAAALIQAAWYNYSAEKFNKRTVQMQKYVENMITHSNLFNMYTFLEIREMTRKDQDNVAGKQVVSLAKDTITFNKSIDYSNINADKCKDIIFESGTVKPKVYGDKISAFLNSSDQVLKITLKFELTKEGVDRFISMTARLLEYDICVLHNMHF